MMGARVRVRRPRRPEVDGSVLRWPGAANRFALFGEVMWVGILVVAFSLPIVTAPAALAAGIRHLRRFLVAEVSSVGAFARDVRDALIGGVVVALVVVVVAAVLVWDLLLVVGGTLPGGMVVGAVGVLGLVALGVALVVAASRWTPERGWWAAVRAVPAAIGADAVGAAYLVAAVVLTVVVTWQLVPLVVPGVGCLVFATVAVGERRRIRESSR